MEKLKCLCCGSSNLIDGGLQIQVCGDASLKMDNITSKTCLDCGHVMIFNSEYKDQVNKEKIIVIESQKKHDDDVQELNDKLIPLKSEMDSLQEKMQSLNKIISDENQTVRTIKEAMAEKATIGEKIEKLRKPIWQLENEISSINKTLEQIRRSNPHG